MKLPNPIASSRLVAAALILIGAMPALADVLVVRGPGATHPTLQAAINAAVDGDVILVRAGTDSSALISAKGIAIVVEPGAIAVVNGSFTIEQLASAQSVVVTGLKIQPLSTQASAVVVQS